MEDYLDDNGWVPGDRSDILVDEAMQKAQYTQAGGTVGTNINPSQDL